MPMQRYLGKRVRAGAYAYNPSSMRGFGDDVAPPTLKAPSSAITATSLRDAINSEPVSTIAAIALVYHGYKRSNGSLFWALLYGLAGKWFPIEAVPIALAQGFGLRKRECIQWDR